MNGITIMLIAIAVLGGGYLLYGRWLAKLWGVDPKAKTPAYEMEDGVDYTPAEPGVVFGHQFASIAGAGPINGPIQAAIFGFVKDTFGWSAIFITIGCLYIVMLVLTLLARKMKTKKKKNLTFCIPPLKIFRCVPL